MMRLHFVTLLTVFYPLKCEKVCGARFAKRSYTVLWVIYAMVLYSQLAQNVIAQN